MAKAKCSICGQEYDVCHSCLEQKTFKPWKAITDSIEHYKIYLAIHGYTISKDKERAKRELQNCDLTGLENFNKEIKTVIKEIMSEQTKPVSKKYKKTENDKILETNKNDNE